MSYEYRTRPFEHQRRIFEATWDRPAFGLFWEQGTGKTKAIIDTAAHLYEQGKIDTLVVVAPNGVHRNWITDEIPVHMPKRLAPATRMMFWESKKTKTKRHQNAVAEVVEHDGLRIMALNYEAMLTKPGEKALKQLFVNHDVLLVFDESHYLKSPGARRTMRGIALARRAKFTRILTGTPIANSPFDAYSQLKVLDDQYWKKHGFSVFSTFKVHFGIFQPAPFQTAHSLGQCVGYRNLDQLKAMIDPVTDRVTKDEVLDLPPKLYQRRFFELTDEQKRVYKEVKEEALAFLESGETVTAPLAITRLLRLQQVTCGFVPTDDGDLEEFGGENPRLDLLEEICSELGHKAIIWARFRRDIDLIMKRLGDRAVRYDGSTSDDDRQLAKQRFQDPEDPVQFFVGNPAAAATGLTLHRARTVIYASNSFKLTDRLQSEDRAHRIGQEHPVAYIDLIAPGTVDERIVRALREKHDIATILTGDRLKEWI